MDSSNGSIIQREKDKPKSKCKKWELRVPTGLDPRTGKYKAKSRRFNGSYTEAKRALREFQDEVEGDRVQGKTGYTFQQYCERYLESARRRGRSHPRRRRGSVGSSRLSAATSATSSSSRLRLPCSTTCISR
jgi:hypothetical protein